MDMILAGPGRAGTALCLAAVASGHRVVGVVGRGSVGEIAGRFDAIPLGFDENLPVADLLLVAVRDDAIEEVAGRLAPHARRVGEAVHLSGLKTAAALDRLAAVGLATGAVHPLQTLPTPEAGAAALPGSWFAVAADDPAFHSRLDGFVRSIGGHPFTLDDRNRALYHAAAATAANDTVAVLALAGRLFAAAEIPLEAARPLVDAVVANAFRLGPKASLTGPIARGDVSTVAAQIEAVRDRVPAVAEQFVALSRVVANLAGTADAFEGVL